MAMKIKIIIIIRICENMVPFCVIKDVRKTAMLR